MMAASEYPNSDVLVSAAWLAQHAHDPDVKIIDARSAQDYAAGRCGTYPRGSSPAKRRFPVDPRTGAPLRLAAHRHDLDRPDR